MTPVAYAPVSRAMINLRPTDARPDFRLSLRTPVRDPSQQDARMALEDANAACPLLRGRPFGMPSADTPYGVAFADI
ncbi:MAG: hypothetical protein K2H17_10870 [Duncaniella sp.]|uniref:hypothetical protein n=1 Tax=Duncaniella sp. TaxID=2518496 RepID=UPI0023C89588|nr:hypothetical protein [Duncaniella sp.]MDE5989883.1 hypothetical protein [Duncaniella sp.]